MSGSGVRIGSAREAARRSLKIEYDREMLFPRSIDRGPIEAVAALSTRRHDAVHFRDQSIAAPLKLVRYSMPVRVSTYFRDRMIAAPLKRRSRSARPR